MRIRIEEVNDEAEDEIVVRCRKVTPEIESLARELGLLEKQAGGGSGHNKKRNVAAGSLTPEFYKGEQQYFLSFSEILFFETEDEKVIAHTATDAYETKQRLYELESMLPASFVRVSRSTIANVTHIFSIQRGLTRVSHITFRGSYKEVYASRKYGPVLKVKMEERYLYEQN
ncbi:MAG: LytTR family DNA-binding domain-containing protein [Oscillospiraceae bacterium]|nr:LytTR family DNA-binding domain-containing protein [Oscillospiraceae bacterium]